MELAALVIFAGALLINAGSPGPSIAALVARVISHGLGSVLPFLLAMWIGEAMWLTVAAFGLSYVAESFATVFTIVKYLGVAYLLYLAYQMWTAPTHASDGQLPPPQAPWRMFLTGMALTLGNPKIMVFYMALLPTLIDLANISLFGWAELVIVALLVMMTVDLAWAFAAAWARQWLRSPRAMKIANRVGATAMTGAVAAIASR
jgi:threonine/homoserine/homoserine lactone efflux protein